MAQLSSRDLRAAVDTLRVIAEACAQTPGFARQGVTGMAQLLGADLTTLSICDLESGHRTVVSDHPALTSSDACAVFDHHFHTHPLVRAHGRNPAAATLCIDDLLPAPAFRRTPLFNEYYRVLGIDQVMAVPLQVGPRLLVSFVLNRSRIPFGRRDRDLAELVRPALASLYRLASSRAGTRAPPAAPPRVPLTAREREVLGWVAAGKTNRDVATILGASPRTVEKHLERAFEKLGVETRTAAIVRAGIVQRPL